MIIIFFRKNSFNLFKYKLLILKDLTTAQNIYNMFIIKHLSLYHLVLPRPSPVLTRLKEPLPAQ